MTSELDERPGGNSVPAWFACWFFGLLLLALAVAEYLYVRDYERWGGHPPVEKQQEREVRRSPYAKVAQWWYPHIGTWGCVAVFALPGLGLVTVGELIRRRGLWR